MISSVTNPKIKDILKLQSKKGRDESGMFLVEGLHLIEEANNAGCLIEIFALNDNIFNNATVVSDNVMKKISSTKTPPGFVGLCKKLNRSNGVKKMVILDGVQDPGNVGAIIRSALAFNFDTICLLEGCADIYNSKTIRATQGALFKINIVNSFEHFPGKIYATSLNDKSTELSATKNTDMVAIILGNEGCGVSKEYLDKYESIYISINEVESLNVAVAGSIIMNHFK